MGQYKEKMARVLLFDDMADLIGCDIESKLDGVAVSEVSLTHYYYDRLRKRGFPYNEKCLVFIDATYSNSEH